MAEFETVARWAARAIGGASVLALGSVAQAVELNYSVGLGPGSTVTQDVEAYAKKVAEWTDGDVTVNVFPLSLVSLPEMGPGIRDGLTDIGFMAAPYYPAEFAHTNFLAELTMMLRLLDVREGREGAAFAGAISEYILTKCPECLDEYEKQNHVYMGHMSTSPYVMLCNSKVTTADDLQGKRLRAGSAAYQRFAEHFGATGVQMPASEAYEALNQGVLDCAMLSAGDLTNYRLMEVVDAVTVGVPGNVYGGTVAGNINRDVWQGLTEEQREALLRGTAWLAAHMTWSYLDLQNRDLAAAEEQGISVDEASPELIDELRNFVNQDQEVVAKIFAENFGITNAQEMQEEFRPVLERWVELVKDVESAEDLTEIYWNEIYSKLDPATYALN